MRKFACFIFAVLMMSGIVISSGVFSGEAMAECLNADDTKAEDNVFLMFRSWYYNVKLDNACSPVIYADPDNPQDYELNQFVWTVILNVVFDLFAAIGVIAAGYMIYGGYAYLTAGGDPGKVSKAQKSIAASIIGIAVALSARMIVSAITMFIGDSPGTVNDPNDPNSVLNGAFNLAFAVVGMVATAFIVYGGYLYMTSAGDPGKAKKGRTTLTFSIVGLLVVLLAFAIVNFVVGAME